MAEGVESRQPHFSIGTLPCRAKQKIVLPCWKMALSADSRPAVIAVGEMRGAYGAAIDWVPLRHSFDMAVIKMRDALEPTSS